MGVRLWEFGMGVRLWGVRLRGVRYHALVLRGQPLNGDLVRFQAKLWEHGNGSTVMGVR